MEHLSKVIAAIIAIGSIAIAVLLQRTTWSKWAVTPLVIVAMLVSTTGIYHLAFSPQIAYAAVGLDTSASQAEGVCNSSGTGNLLSYTAAANTLVVVGILTGGGLSVSSVAWNGNAMTLISNQSTGSGDLMYLYYYYTSAGGTGNVAITTVVNTNCTYGAISLTGVDSVDPIAASSTASAFATSVTTNVNTTDDNSWIVDLVGVSSLQQFTATNGQTIVASSSLTTDVAGMVIGYRGPITPAASTADGYSLTTGGAASIGINVAAIRPVRNIGVRTDGTSAVLATTATLNGTIRVNASNDVTQSGFAWGTNSTLTGGDTATTTEGSQSGTASFTSSLSGLTGLTTYYARSYITSTAHGTTYGAITSFTTLCDPTAAAGCDVTFSTTGYQTWTVPADTQTLNVACWGGGGGGGILAAGGGGGAGGGAYASSTVSVSASDVIRLFVGAGGATELSGATSTASTTVPATIVLAASGGRARDLAAGVGGLASLSTGTTKANGGNGGTGLTTDDTGGGGGGAGGPSGAGNVGANGTATTGGAGGTGNAAAGGTAGTADTNGATTPGGGPGGASVLGGGGGGGGDNGDPGGDGGIRGGGGGGGEIAGSGTEGGQGGNGACQIHYYGVAAAPAPSGADHGVIWFNV